MRHYLLLGLLVTGIFACININESDDRLGAFIVWCMIGGVTLGMFIRLITEENGAKQEESKKEG